MSFKYKLLSLLSFFSPADGGSAGMKFLINNTNVNNRSELQSKQMLERDLVCLSLDGFRRAARLCCDLGKISLLSELDH